MEAFFCLCKGIPEDQGNEIGQWKDCFDKLRLKRRCCYPWLLLGMETESFRGRHTDTTMEANGFFVKVKSYIKFNKEPKYRFLIKNKVITDKFNPTPTITEFKQQFTVMDRFS